jgi:hypothetical protein
VYQEINFFSRYAPRNQETKKYKKKYQDIKHEISRYQFFFSSLSSYQEIAGLDIVSS